MGHHQLDELDYKILKLVASNARIPFLEVARECNVSGAAIHQRVQKLTNLGILKGSEYLIDSNKIGFETCAYMGFYLKNPGDFSHVVEKLRKIPEVVECHLRQDSTICLSNCSHVIISIYLKLFIRNYSPSVYLAPRR